MFCVKILNRFDISMKIYYGWMFFIESTIKTHRLLCSFCSTIFFQKIRLYLFYPDDIRSTEKISPVHVHVCCRISDLLGPQVSPILDVSCRPFEQDYMRQQSLHNTIDGSNIVDIFFLLKKRIIIPM